MSDRPHEPSHSQPVEIAVSKLCKECDRLVHAFTLKKSLKSQEWTEKVLDHERTGKVFDLFSERDFGEIQQSATQCPICITAHWVILRHDPLVATSNKFRFNFGQGNFSDGANLQIERLSLPSEERSTPWLNFCISFLPLRGKDLRTVQLAMEYEYAPRTDDRSVIELIRLWHLQCSTEHPNCAARMVSYQPPRLLEIRSDSFRLVLKKERRTIHPYATLSHCWGPKPNFLKLTASYFDELRQWTPINRLPRTFKDALTLCHHIHIACLWIDSLCIIQEGEGSLRDWSYHVTEMRTIYLNGALNIAASRAASSCESFYTSRDPRHIKPAVIMGSQRYGLSEELYLLCDATELDGKISNLQPPSTNQYRCPSWSWAKVDTGIYYNPKICFSPEVKHLISIQDVETTPVDPNNTFGNLKDGYISLKGCLLPWKVVDQSPDPVDCSFDTEELSHINTREL